MEIMNRLPEQGTIGFFGGVFVGACLSTLLWWFIILACFAAEWSK